MAVRARQIELAAPRARGGRTAPEKPLTEMNALFVSPYDHLKRMARLAASRGERFQHFESAQAPQRAVEDSAFGDRIDMRAEKNDR